jgi:peptide/nickel transport system permease protein
VLVIFIGVTLTFLIPRLSPINPVQNAVGRLSAFQTLSPEASLALQESLEDLYGLNGTLFEQYFAFWQRILSGDLGPSFTSFPMTVNAMIASGIWWTVGLLATATLISWLLGILLGTLSGYFPNRWWAKTLSPISSSPSPCSCSSLTTCPSFPWWVARRAKPSSVLVISAASSTIVFCPQYR